MVFGYDVPVKFSVEGACKTASVHLTGYFQPGPDDDEEEEDEDEDGKILIYSFASMIKNRRQPILSIRLSSSDEGMDEEMYKKLLAEGGKGGDDSDDEEGKNLRDC